VCFADAIYGYFANWRTLLTDNVSDGRQLLREFLEGAIQFMPEVRAYRFKATVATGRLVAGLATQGVSTRGASPGGTATGVRWWPPTVVEGVAA
jgi:hypothetical protein